MSYAAIQDTEKFLEKFATNYYGSKLSPLGTLWIDTVSVQSDLDSSFGRINTYL